MDRDFMHFFQIDLAEVFAGRTRFTPRRLLSFLEMFPEGSEFDAARLGNRALRDWGIQTQILATLHDDANFNTIAVANWEKGKRPVFKPMDRPKSKFHEEQEAAEKADSSGKTLADLFSVFSAGKLPTATRKT